MEKYLDMDRILVLTVTFSFFIYHSPVIFIASLIRNTSITQV